VNRNGRGGKPNLSFLPCDPCGAAFSSEAA
jgi:hypothetical protein